ncbi:MAG: hypothetical protein GC208_10305 [Alphaproteobacteria bacterium]|nr:hypothetical protein [Alphaproteobacteria bacterium]
MRQLSIKLPSGHQVTIQEPRIVTEEAVAVSYTEKQLVGGQSRRFARDLCAAAIVEFDGKRVDDLFNPRQALSSFADWNVLEAAYNSMLGVESIMAATNSAVEQLKQNKNTSVEVTMSDGRLVTLVPLTIDQVEELEVRGRYGANEWFRALHDRAAASVSKVNGEAVIPGVFNARVEFPLSRDWAVLKAVTAEMNSAEVDPRDFFPSIPA